MNPWAMQIDRPIAGAVLSEFRFVAQLRSDVVRTGVVGAIGRGGLLVGIIEPTMPIVAGKWCCCLVSSETVVCRAALWCPV